MHPDRDPYAPPPRHTDKSGAIVRILILAALIGAAAWGYMEVSQSQTADLTPPAQEQTLADAGADMGYAVEQPSAESSETPQQAPSSAPAPAAPAQQPSEPLPAADNDDGAASGELKGLVSPSGFEPETL